MEHHAFRRPPYFGHGAGDADRHSSPRLWGALGRVQIAKGGWEVPLHPESAARDVRVVAHETGDQLAGSGCDPRLRRAGRLAGIRFTVVVPTETAEKFRKAA